MKFNCEHLDCLTTSVVNIDYDFKITTVNSAAESLFNLSKANLFGINLSNLVVDKNFFDQLFDDVLHDRFSNKKFLSHWFIPSVGSLELDTICTLVKNKSVLCCIEIREKNQILKLDKEQRQEDLAEANRSLLRNLGHEVKNPLGGIRGAAQLLDSELPNPYLKEYTQIIIKEADRLQSLVDGILLPSKNKLNYKKINIHELSERVIMLIGSEFKKIEIKSDYDVSIPNLWGDEVQLVQVLMNLMKNAAESVNDQNSSKIVVKTRIARQVTLKKKRCLIALNLEIIDNGPGIPADIKDQIFYPLVSGKNDGHGLGLTIVQSIVNSHGGVIECSSSKLDTIFKVVLPIKFAKEL